MTVNTINLSTANDSNESGPTLEQALASQQPSLEKAFQVQQAQLNKALRRKPKLSKKRSKELLEREQWLKDRANGKRPQVKGPAPGLELRIQISKTKFVTLPAEQAHLYAEIKGDIRPGPAAGRYIPPSPGPGLPRSTISRGKTATGRNELKKVGTGRTKKAIGESKHKSTREAPCQK